MKAEPCSTPRLSTLDALLLIVGLVIGSGIFKTPSMVAAEASNSPSLFLFWIVGGLISLTGALCYAELASRDPDPGGDYHFLGRAYGPKLAFLFGWSRLAVLQTGSIALLAFVFGDYVDKIFPLGTFGPGLWAAVLILIVTATQLAGLRQGTHLQRFLTGAQLLGLSLLVVGGLILSRAESAAPALTAPEASTGGAAGLALVFVMLTFGGWNEAAYLSADLRNPKHFVRALLGGIAVITSFYLLINLACLRVLGLEGMARSQAVIADLGEAVAGPLGLALVSLLVALSAATSTNATILTGARGVYALGRDFSAFRSLASWNSQTGIPKKALIAQAGVALFLVAFGATTKSGFTTMVEYTAPVFWFFILMVGLSLFILRSKDPESTPSFTVPLYPLTPLIFCASSGFMLWSSLNYTGGGALLGVAVLAAGLPILFFTRSDHLDSHQAFSKRRKTNEENNREHNPEPSLSAGVH